MESRVPEHFGKHHIVAIDHKTVSGRPVGVRVFSGEQGGVRRESCGYYGHEVGKQNRLAGQGIEIGRANPRVAVTSEVIGPSCVQRDDDNMWAFPRPSRTTEMYRQADQANDPSRAIS